MQQADYYIPAHLTTQLVRGLWLGCACESVRVGVKMGKLEEVLKSLETFTLSPEGNTHALVSLGVLVRPDAPARALLP